MRHAWVYGIFASLASLPAMAAQPVLIPLNVPGTYTVAPPPPGFDPVRASDDDLATYGFPQRPSGLNRRALEHWMRIMRHARERIIPRLRITNRVAGPAILVPRSGVRPDVLASEGAATQYSKNWSGMVISNGNPSFGPASVRNAAGTLNVPVAEPAFGTCSGGVHVASWVGIDGIGSKDVLQAGIEADNYCTGGSSASYYSPWMEWYPGNLMDITNFAIAPGHVIEVYLAANSATNGAALVEDATTNQYVYLGINAPSGTQLVGDSVEWIIERPSFNNVISTLANYVTAWQSGTGAAINGVWYDYAWPLAGNTAFPLQMLDNNGNQISTVTTLWPDGMVFNDSGSAK